MVVSVFFFQAEDGIRGHCVTGVQTCALPIFRGPEFWLRTTAKTPREAYPGQSWRFWQYSSTGLIDGIQGEVDLNAFAGSRAEWNAWLAARAVQ